MVTDGALILADIERPVEDAAQMMHEAADRIPTLERELEEARARVAELEAKLERESGDLRYAKNALDRETARAIKFGARATAAEAKVARMGEAVPVGWMLVPREPTEAMKREGVTKALSVSLGAGYTWPDYMADLWSAMLYASPGPRRANANRLVKRGLLERREPPSSEGYAITDAGRAALTRSQP